MTPANGWSKRLCGAARNTGCVGSGSPLAIANDTPKQIQHSISELTPIAKIHLGNRPTGLQSPAMPCG